MYMSRRDMMFAACASSGLALPACMNRFSGDSNRLQTIGIQLRSVRDQMARSVPETLNMLSGFGYREVEFATNGYFGHGPLEIETMLAENNLTAPSTYVRIPQLKTNLAETLDRVAEYGHDYAVMAYLSPNERRSLDDYKAYVDLFSRVGEAAKKRGIQFEYHGHDFEFEALQGIIPYDLLLEQIDPELMSFTLDTYWFARAGQDPLRYINLHPGRFKQCHLKDMATDHSVVDIGTGIIDFSKLFAARDVAGFEHYYVDDNRMVDSLETAFMNLKNLQQIQF